MQTITLYYTHIYDGFCIGDTGTFYRLQPHQNTSKSYIKGYTVDRQNYILPDGLTVALGNDNMLHLYDIKDQHVQLTTIDDRPFVVGNGYCEFLKTA